MVLYFNLLFWGGPTEKRLVASYLSRSSTPKHTLGIANEVQVVEYGVCEHVWDLLFDCVCAASIKVF